jgi:hypothetical protein
MENVLPPITDSSQYISLKGALSSNTFLTETLHETFRQEIFERISEFYIIRGSFTEDFLSSLPEWLHPYALRIGQEKTRLESPKHTDGLCEIQSERYRRKWFETKAFFGNKQQANHRFHIGYINIEKTISKLQSEHVLVYRLLKKYSRIILKGGAVVSILRNNPCEEPINDMDLNFIGADKEHSFVLILNILQDIIEYSNEMAHAATLANRNASYSYNRDKVEISEPHFERQGVVFKISNIYGYKLPIEIIIQSYVNYEEIIHQPSMHIYQAFFHNDKFFIPELGFKELIEGAIVIQQTYSYLPPPNRIIKAIEKGYMIIFINFDTSKVNVGGTCKFANMTFKKENSKLFILQPPTETTIDSLDKNSFEEEGEYNNNKTKEKVKIYTQQYHEPSKTPFEAASFTARINNFVVVESLYRDFISSALINKQLLDGFKFCQNDKTIGKLFDLIPSNLDDKFLRAMLSNLSSSFVSDYELTEKFSKHITFISLANAKELYDIAPIADQQPLLDKYIGIQEVILTEFLELLRYGRFETLVPGTDKIITASFKHPELTTKHMLSRTNAVFSKGIKDGRTYFGRYYKQDNTFFDLTNPVKEREYSIAQNIENIFGISTDELIELSKETPVNGITFTMESLPSQVETTVNKSKSKTRRDKKKAKKLLVSKSSSGDSCEN